MGAQFVLHSPAALIARQWLSTVQPFAGTTAAHKPELRKTFASRWRVCATSFAVPLVVGSLFTDNDSILLTVSK